MKLVKLLIIASVLTCATAAIVRGKIIEISQKVKHSYEMKKKHSLSFVRYIKI